MSTLDLDPSDLAFLAQLGADVVEGSRVRPGQKIGKFPANTQPFALIRPGGRDCYPAFWIRDFAMSLASGLISQDEITNHLRLTAEKQNGPSERKLLSGAIIPPHAIPDHINFDGDAVFYPGTMSAGEDQGGEPFGILPPADDHYYFISTAFHLTSGTLLHEKINDVPLIDRLISAFNVPTSDPATGGMVCTTPETRAVGFGFCDTVYLTGSMLFPSLLRHTAARLLADLCADCSRPTDEAQYRKIAEAIASHIVPVFADPKARHGWLLAATGVGRQPDVWGTLYALHLNILPRDFARRARDTIADAVRRGTITSVGAVRHIPTDFDASATSAWEKVAPNFKIGAYQNGGYWHTPTGWLIEALHRDHPDLANQVWREYISHLRDHDFRKGPNEGAPYECFGENARSPLNPVYMTSVTVPLAVIRDLNVNKEQAR